MSDPSVVFLRFSFKDSSRVSPSTLIVDITQSQIVSSYVVPSGKERHQMIKADLEGIGDYLPYSAFLPDSLLSDDTRDNTIPVASPLEMGRYIQGIFAETSSEVKVFFDFREVGAHNVLP